MKDDDDTLCYRSELEAAVKAASAAELKACCDLLEGMHEATDGNHNYYLYAAKELRRLRKP